MKRFIGPILLLLALHAYPQTPATHTFSSNQVIDTIFSDQAPARQGPQSQTIPGQRNPRTTTDNRAPASVVSGAPLLSANNRALAPSPNNRPLQPFQMRAQLLTGAGAKTSSSVTLSNINLNITTTPSTCDGNNGTIVVSGSGGTAPYQYQLDGGSWTFSGIFFCHAGSHSLSVKDAAGNSGTATVTVTNNYNAPLVSAASIVNPTGCQASDGSVTLQASGGASPYTYSMDGQTWQASPTFTGLPMGWYYIYVKDANGCTGSGNFFTRSCSGYGFANTNATCGASNGEISGTLYPYTANPPYTYALDAGAYQATMDFPGLAPGLHIVHTKDASGTVIDFAWYIANICDLTLKVVTLNGTCTAGGSITATATNGTAPYLYSIDGINYQSGNVFSNLADGNYTVVVKDAAGKLQGLSVTIATSCLRGHATSKNAYCGNNDGSITATSTGGTPPYTFNLKMGAYNVTNSTGSFTGLAPGTYTLTFSDAGGINPSGQITVGITPCLTVSATPVASTCGSSNGRINATGAGGIAPYTYSLDGTNFQASPQFTGLAAGNYTITVKDAANPANQTTGSVVTVGNIAGPSVSWTMRPSDCNDQGGLLTVTATGGTAPYLYGYSPYFLESNNSWPLPAGQYQAVVMDANGCQASAAATVVQACLEVTATGTDASCGNNDGSITGSASNGTPPYLYSMDGGSYQSNPVFPGLAPGSHTLTAKDAGTLSNAVTVTLASVCIAVSPTPKDENCNQQNGAITVAAAGGTAPYQYSLDGVNFQTSNLFGALKAGNYTVTAKDNRGFIGTKNVSLANTPAPGIGVATTAASCRNDDGTIRITGTGGVAPYMYSIDGGSFVSGGLFGQLASGSHAAAVRDADGCVTPQSAVVALDNTLVVSAGPDPTICEGKSAVLPVTSNGATFSWQPSAGLDNPSVLQPAASPSTTTMYTVTATDGACQQTGSVSVIVNPAPTPDPGQNTTICYGASTQLQGAGGTSFVWSPSTYLSDPTVPDPKVEQPDQTMTYSLSVTDANGCTSLRTVPVTVTVTPPSQLSAGADTAVVEGQPLPLKAVDVNNTGFTRFSWSPSDGLDNPYIQDPVATLPMGVTTYTVKAVSDAGCAAVASITIKVYSVADIFVPSGFSPNGDGHNDVLRPLPVGIREFKYFAVFSRWGQRVFYSADPAIGWSGTVDGRAEDMGTYVWMAVGVDYSGKLVKRQGTVTLVR